MQFNTPNQESFSQISFAPQMTSREEDGEGESAIFGRSSLKSIKDSHIFSPLPPISQQLLQQVETLAKNISLVIALEKIGQYQIEMKEKALKLLEEVVVSQQRALYYLSQKYRQQPVEFSEARKLQIEKVKQIIQILPSLELQNSLKKFTIEISEIQQNQFQGPNEVVSAKNYHCVLQQDISGVNLLKLIEEDSLQLSRDIYFRQQNTNIPLRRFLQLLVINGVQQNKHSFQNLSEFIASHRQEQQLLIEISLIKALFKEISSIFENIESSIRQNQVILQEKMKLNHQQLQSVRLLYDSMTEKSKNIPPDFGVPQSLYPILVNTQLLCNQNNQEGFVCQLVADIHHRLSQQAVKGQCMKFENISQFFVSSQLRMLLLTYQHFGKDDIQEIDPELFKLQVMLPQDSKIFEILLSLPCIEPGNLFLPSEPPSQFVPQNEMKEWYDILDKCAELEACIQAEGENFQQIKVKIDESTRNILASQNDEKQFITWKFIGILKQFISNLKVDEHVFQQLWTLTEQDQSQFLAQPENSNKSETQDLSFNLNCQSLISYYRCRVKKSTEKQKQEKLCDEIDPFWKDNFSDLLELINSYKEDSKGEFINAVKQYYDPQLKSFLQKLKSFGSKQVQNGVDVIFENIKFD